MANAAMGRYGLIAALVTLTCTGGSLAAAAPAAPGSIVLGVGARLEEAQKVAAEVAKEYPGAVDHSAIDSDLGELHKVQDQVVRVHLETDKWRDVRLLGVEDRSLLVQSKSRGNLDTLALADVRTVYRNRGRRPTAAGALVGAVVGLFLGPAILYAAVARGSGEENNNAGIVLGGIVYGTGVGALAGSVAFHAWERIYGHE